MLHGFHGLKSVECKLTIHVYKINMEWWTLLMRVSKNNTH